MKRRLVSLLCGLAVIAFGIQIGAAIYEARVITHLWAGSPPESVRNWNPVSELAVQPERYWIPGSMLAMAAILGLFIAAVPRSAARRWCLFAALAGLAVMLSTGLFFVPILRETIFNNGANLSDAEIVEKVHLWTSWNWLRLAVVVAGWLAAMRGMVMAGAPHAAVGSRYPLPPISAPTL